MNFRRLSIAPLVLERFAIRPIAVVAAVLAIAAPATVGLAIAALVTVGHAIVLPVMLVAEITVRADLLTLALGDLGHLGVVVRLLAVSHDVLPRPVVVTAVE